MGTVCHAACSRHGHGALRLEQAKTSQGQFRFSRPSHWHRVFFAAFLQAFPQERIEAARGVELDKAFADAARAIWKRQGLQVTQGDFTRQQPGSAT